MSEVVMPKLGETTSEGTITRWFKNVGDRVMRGEPLCEVSTDKVDSEIVANCDGVLSSILVGEGTTVGVGTTLALIGEQTSVSESIRAATPTANSLGQSKGMLAMSGQSISKNALRLSPRVRSLLRDLDCDTSTIVGSGLEGRITARDIAAYTNAIDTVVPAHVTYTAEEKPVLSPLVRKLLRDNSLDMSTIMSTGPHGRLSRKDVEREVQSKLRGQVDEIVPFTKIRRLTAEHMVRSKAVSAHTLMVKEVDFERVDQVRRSYGEAFKAREGFGLTYLSFNACASVQALEEFPHLNASVGNEELIVHRAVNLGIAVDLGSEGLIVPVVRNARDLSLAEMARQLKQLAIRARTKKLTLDDVNGGTFSITNPGPFGTLITGAIINQPQVAILSTDGVSRKPVVLTSTDGDESIAIHSIGNLALTFDHRAIDGAYAARFLARLAEILYERDWASELTSSVKP